MYINTDIFKIETNHIVPTQGKILISEPFLCDHMFGRSVILLVDHAQDGTMGLIPVSYTHLTLPTNREV